MRSARIRTQTDPPLPKGSRDRYYEVVAPDGSMHGRVLKTQNRPVPEHVRLVRLAARKAMYRAAAALAAYDENHRTLATFTITTSNAYPIGGQQ